MLAESKKKINSTLASASRDIKSFYKYASISEEVERYEKEIDNAQRRLTTYSSLLTDLQRAELMSLIESAKKQIGILTINKHNN
jgi:uncharacterized protein Yka (UPF0111/DUF47 family)